ncbi:MAG TPA: DUF6010 family protein [Pyrinomonadaceae bacterium]|nr:DUF6010 family protein [Pyrinomonadaceae bacterium]
MQTVIELVVGFFLGVGFLALIRRSGSYAREKRSIAIGLVVAALIYVGFGIFSGSLRWLLIELAGVPIYAVFAWLGVRRSGWFLAAGWALHPLWDAGLHDYSTQFVPDWYIAGCIGFDLLVAAYTGFREVKT